ncbi:MAG: hypothetical protein J6D28_00540 [Bacilli bacterium]|nr:hypothetical protein [Bacilli bacterium]
MNEKKKTIVLFVIAFFVILMIIVGSLFEEMKSKNYLKDFYDVFDASENRLVMIGRDNCSWCLLFSPILEFMSEHYDFDFTYINTNELTDGAFKRLLKDINVSADEFGTPLTLVVRDGAVVDSLSGYTDEPELLDFLKDHGFVDDKAKTVLNYIDYGEYKKIIKSKSAQILVIGQTTCSYCIKAKPVLSKVASDYDIDINFFNINELSEDDRKSFEDSLSYYGDNDWGTPLTLIVKNGEVIDDSNGMLDYDGYVSLFKKNNFIK